MIFSRIAPLFLAALAPLAAADFPVVRRSDRVLTVAQVKTFWVNRLRAQALPTKATSPDPENEDTRRVEAHRRRVLMEEIRAGQHDLAARLVCLSHNVEAWSRLGDESKSEASEQRLIFLREHVARLVTLEAQREAAVKLGEAADRTVAMSEEIQRLKGLLARQDEACG
ncbi:hypothetical protein OKA04_23115 [Luteolibacter flavescens]|uniref:Secreted protein n=1 Tax=Luteolibacter flavescens TaxID=1859460 RepID=A0ABT3FW70_9BACT|nr:hypothetical protein [Luteolibacter flavescens]MCW1887647.1 hypothetical protein [Luteolibacter flavescens]